MRVLSGGRSRGTPEASVLWFASPIWLPAGYKSNHAHARESERWREREKERESYFFFCEDEGVVENDGAAVSGYLRHKAVLHRDKYQITKDKETKKSRKTRIDLCDTNFGHVEDKPRNSLYYRNRKIQHRSRRLGRFTD